MALYCNIVHCKSASTVAFNVLYVNKFIHKKNFKKSIVSKQWFVVMPTMASVCLKETIHSVLYI